MLKIADSNLTKIKGHCSSEDWRRLHDILWISTEEEVVEYGKWCDGHEIPEIRCESKIKLITITRMITYLRLVRSFNSLVEK
jgi:hypothetical protein